jgi:hypothetical protein
MDTSYLDFRDALRRSVQRALGQALPAKPRVARHWVDPSRLAWLGLLSEQTRFHLSWSLGTLVDAPVTGRHTAGVFLLDDTVFPQVDAAGLTARLLALVPSDLDGATRAFLIRVTAQLALADLAHDFGALPLPTIDDFLITVPVRPDALDTPAPAPRMPAHAEQRVTQALARMPLGPRILNIFAAPAPTLLEAVAAERLTPR